jgi:hypothetical protein
MGIEPTQKEEALKSTEIDLDKLAYAVAMAETANCTTGMGPTRNNCFGIKNGNTAPCDRMSASRFCIYETPEQSYEAFKKIWSTWYKGFPTIAQARRWTGNDRPHHWLNTVTQYYNE